jgi:uncharacterized protein HemY
MDVRPLTPYLEETTLSSDKNGITTRLLRAQEAFDDGQLNAAIAHIQVILRNTPNHTVARKFKAKIIEAQKLQVAAEEVEQEVMKLITEVEGFQTLPGQNSDKMDNLLGVSDNQE